MHPATFHHMETITYDTATFWFSPDKPLRYLAGQFVELRIDSHMLNSTDQKRWFTLSSSPTEKLLGVTTKLAKDMTPFKKRLQLLKPGAKVTVSEPMGDFVLPRDDSKPLLFVAAGIGITPIRSMLTYLKDTGDKRSVTLLYAVKDTEHIAFEQLVNKETNVTIFSRATQSLTAHDIQKALKSQPSSIVYISGPETMVEQLVDQLRDIVGQNQLVTDYFPGYAPL